MSKLRKSGLRLRGRVDEPVEGVVGPVRFARRDADLAALRDGDIALVDLVDLDERRAGELIEARVAAVLNTAPSSTGRVPNQGPKLLADAGVTLVDVGNEGIWSRLRNGEVVQVLDGRVLLDGTLIATGVVQDASRVASTLKNAQDGLSTRLDALTVNAADHISREQGMLLGGVGVPRLRTRVRQRPVIVVSKDYDAEADLAALKRFIAQNDPVLIGAGAGADLLIAAGHRVHVLVGDADRLSERAIREAGEVVVTTTTGRVSRPERLEKHGKDVVTFTSTGADDDAAILLADTNEASVIIHAGAPPSLNALLERAPSDSARQVVTRLRAGSRLVDAKAAVSLSPRPMSLWPVLLMLLVGLVTVAVAITVTPLGQDWFEQVRQGWDDLGSSIGGLFS
ncbi:MAG TPA: putative cytokinetic ring protein SteA [Aeromicrobium sp.]|nr:putative cytokinetic ring protein SteA [Aeromicrobium sp.]